MASSNLIRIDDPADPAISEFLSIRERDLTGRGGYFIAEGAVVLRMLAAAHAQNGAFVAEKILVLENKVEGISDILSAFPLDVPVYTASSAILDQIAGFHLHRGILALGRKLPAPAIGEILSHLPQKSLVLVGIGMANHDNVGSMFRNAAAFGVDHFFLDQTSCDPLYRKSIRVSVGSVLSVPWTRQQSAENLVSELSNQNFEIWGLSPRGATDLRTISLPDRIAVVMGTEGEGLPEALMQRIKTARIAQMPGLDSLNVATATGIALYQIATAMRRL